MWMHLDHARSGSCKFVAKCFAKQISEHNSQLSGRRESRCARIETTDTWQYLNILFRSLSRYQIWTLWRNRVAQDIFLMSYIVILTRILHCITPYWVRPLHSMFSYQSFSTKKNHLITMLSSLFGSLYFEINLIWLYFLLALATH